MLPVAMKISHFSILGTILIFFLFTFQAFAIDTETTGSGDWSNASIWSNGVPTNNEDVRINAGHEVIFNIESSNTIRTLLVNGTLDFSTTRNTRMIASLIVISENPDFNVDNDSCSHNHSGGHQHGVGAAFRVGTVENPIPAGVNATVTLKYVSGLDQNCAPGIIAHGGAMEFHGADIGQTWVKLGKNFRKNTNPNRIEVLDSIQWKIGDQIIVYFN